MHDDARELNGYLPGLSSSSNKTCNDGNEFIRINVFSHMDFEPCKTWHSSPRIDFISLPTMNSESVPFAMFQTLTKCHHGFFVATETRRAAGFSSIALHRNQHVNASRTRWHGPKKQTRAAIGAGNLTYDPEATHRATTKRAHFDRKPYWPCWR